MAAAIRTGNHETNLDRPAVTESGGTGELRWDSRRISDDSHFTMRIVEANTVSITTAGIQLYHCNSVSEAL